MELWNAAISMVNLPFTVLLGLVLLYWLTVILGALDLDFLDLDLDVDGDVELSGFQSVLAFFNLGELPIMLLVSIQVFIMWGIAIFSNHYLEISSVPTSLLLAVPNLLVSLLITKVVSSPLVVFYKKLAHDPQGLLTAIGSLAVLKHDLEPGSVGQVEVKTDGAPMLLMVRTREGRSMAEGSQGIIVEKDESAGIYVIEPFEEWER